MDNFLEIRNYKCFTHKHVPMRRMTVLAGSNSVGKSSVIQSMLLLRLAHEKFTASIGRIPLNGQYVLALGNSFNVVNKNKPDKEIFIRFGYNGRPEAWYFYADINKPQIFLEIQPDKYNNSYRNPILRDNFHYLNAERLGPRPFYNISESDRNVGYQGEYTISLLSSSPAGTREYDVVDERTFPDTKNPRLLSQVQAWMNHIIPGIEIDPKKVQETNLSYVQYGGSSPHNVGFGISYVLPIVVAGLIAKTGEMLIVENPEAHLHPSGQSRIGQFLAVVAASGVEVLVETHSEHVINGIRIAALEGSISHKDVVINFFSTSEDTKSSQPNVESIFLNEQADLEKWPKGFFDQQQADIAKIFKLRKQKSQ